MCVEGRRQVWSWKDKLTILGWFIQAAKTELLDTQKGRTLLHVRHLQAVLRRE